MPARLTPDTVIGKFARHLKLSREEAEYALEKAGWPSKVIGKGGFGMAFVHPDDPDWVVKITGDHSDGEAMRKIVGMRDPSLPRVRKVDYIDVAGGLYAIEVERLEDILGNVPKHIGIAMNDILICWDKTLHDLTDDMRDRYRAGKNVTKAELERFRKGMMEFKEMLLDFTEDAENEKVARTLRLAADSVAKMLELDILTPDLHPVNWGYRRDGDRVVPLDFGCLSTYASR